MEKLVLVDGHSILNRAFYGVPDLTNSEGLHTNAIYGFLNILFKILDEENPDYLTVAFDLHAPTFRHLMYSPYKGTRKPMADELRQQVPVMQDVLKAMGVNVVTMEGYEADDILGTLAKSAEKNGIAVSLVSGDRDLLQIATDNIRIRIPKTKGGKTEIEDYYAKDVLDKYQVDPIGFIDLKALMGDTADNIPGVPKVGEKTATELLVTYGSLDNLYEHVNEVSKNAVRESLIENKELAYLSKTLATIKIDSPVNTDLTDARVGNFYTDEAYVWFKKLEFKNLLSRFETKIDYESITSNFTMIEDCGEATTYVDTLIDDIASKKINRIAVETVYDDKNTAELLGISITDAHRSVFIKKWLFITDDFIESSLLRIAKSEVNIVGFDIKKLYGMLKCDYDDRFDDVLIGAYLLNPLKSDYTQIDVANEYLNLLIQDKSQFAKKLSLSEVIESLPEETKNYLCYLSYVSYHACDKIIARLNETKMISLYKDIEMPLTYVLYEMETQGIEVVKDKLVEYSDMLKESIDLLEKEIYELSGCEFNINSPKQLGEILFEKMQIPGGKKTKTGYSTAADVLEKLKDDYPIVSKILDYRAYTKLKSTYADGLQTCIAADNRIHSTFNQTITATGRLSSTEPNLQNIPIRMELGRRIRKVFVPKDGYIFMDADYSQIELRVLASLADDPELIRAYSEHADIHRSTASLVFHIPYDEVTELDRRKAKAVNFGIVYGISAFGLGEDLKISPKEAKIYIEDYFKTYPKIKEYLDKQVSDAKETGYITTYYNRRRPVPELNSSNFMQRSFGERVAMNSPIQGTAADIIKIAMIRVHNRLKAEGLKSKLILQVHDELLLEVSRDEEEKARTILTEEMIKATDLKVKMEIDLHTGNDWFEAK